MSQKNKEETPVNNLLKKHPKIYNKAKIPIYKHFTDKIKEAVEEDTNLAQLHLWQETTPQSVSTMFDCLQKTKVNSIRSLRLWKINAGDEGINALSNYLLENPDLEIIDLLDNNITKNGCLNFGVTLYKQPSLFKLRKLMIDHNNIGNEGLRKLAHGLRKSPFIEELSLSYCNLEENASNFLQQILMFINSKLHTLNLQGNGLKNRGFNQLLRALEFNEKLKNLNLSDNQIGEDEKLIVQFIKTLKANNCIKNIDLTYNGIYQETAVKIMEVQKEKKQTNIDLTDRFDSDFILTYNAFMLKVKKNKGKKKRKGKKKK